MVCDCGNIRDRDLNAAINLKNKAASFAVSACGEESAGHCITVTKLSSAKQEIAGLHSNVQTL
jgi:putative transposase